MARISPIRICAIVAIGAAALLAAVWPVDLRVPDRWNPFARLRIDEAPTLLTSLKLARASRDDVQCRALLDTARLRYTSLPDRETAPGCGLTNAVRISSTSTEVGSAFALSCRAALSLAMWETHVLQPEARSTYGQPVKRIEHVGSFACRDVRGGMPGRRSRHATADALDIAGFVLADGRRVRVATSWRGDDRDARFLHALHAGACRYFDTALGPDYNAAHRDHFHLDRGSFGLCR